MIQTKNLPGKQYQFISKALPEETFSVVNFKGTEGISKLYEYEITLFSDTSVIVLKDVLKRPATFSILRNGTTRIINGILAHFEQLHEVDNHIFYKALLVPRLWHANLYHENQLFLDKTVPEIIKEILNQTGLTAMDYELVQTRDYPKWEYICQFRETDYHFISRWMEREGFYYFFEQTDNFEKLIITDNLVRHSPIQEQSSYRYSPPSGLTPPEGEVIRNLVCRHNNLPKKVIFKDYNYRKPSVELKSEVVVDPKGKGKIYMYGEHFKTRAEGSILAKVKAEELLCNEQVFYGDSTAPLMTPGFYMTITDHYRQDYNQKYIITEVTHKGSQAAYIMSGLGIKSVDDHDESSDLVYSNQFTAIPQRVSGKELQFRPERKTIKPRFYGTMNAIVDSSGDSSYAEIDDQGRYKVTIPFDLSGKSGGKASRYIRMMQPYAGSNYGMHFPLHKGVEVLLSFIDGDLDRPVINGAVPNPETNSPVSTGNQTQNMLRSAGGNELHFDDTQGSENILLNGTKDWNITIANDKTQSIGNDETLSVTNNRKKSIGLDQTESIGVNKSIQVGSNLDESIGSNMSLQVGSNMSLTVGNNKTETVSVNSTESIGAIKALSIGAAYQVSVGAAMNETIAGIRAEQVGASKTVGVAGSMSETVGGAYSQKGQKVTIEASDEISFKTGAATITLKSSGDISIKGTNISIKGSGNVNIKGTKISQN